MDSRSPKKVLLVIRWPVGGIRTFVRYAFRNFDPQRYQFTILAPTHIETHAMLDDLSLHNIRYVPVNERIGLSAFFFKIGKELLQGKYDLVHSHGFTAGMCVALLSFLCRTPHLMTSHDVINAVQFNGYKGRLMHLGMEKLLSAINCIHSVSYDAQTNLFEYFPGLAKYKEKCVVIPNGIEVERFISAKPRNLHEELGIKGNVFLIGFFGRFMKQKGFSLLVEAVEILRQSGMLPRPFMVFTFGWGGFIREERKAIKEKGLEEHFHFLAFTPNVAGTIKGLDVVAMPSLWEACPLIAMEAIVAGVPVIGTSCIGLREVLNGTPARVVAPADCGALARAIREEMYNPSKKLAKEFQVEAAARFDVRKRVVELESIFQELAARRVSNFDI